MKHMTLGTCTDPPGPKHKLWVRGGGVVWQLFTWYDYYDFITNIVHVYASKKIFSQHILFPKKNTFEVTLSHPLTEIHVWSQFSLNIYVLDCDRKHPKKFPLYVQKYSKCILTTWICGSLCVWGGAEDHPTHRRDILCHYRHL